MELSLSQPSVGKEKFTEPDRLASKYVVKIRRLLEALRDLGSEFQIIKSAESCRQTITTSLTCARALNKVEASLENCFRKG